MTDDSLPPGAIARIVELLGPEEIWLVGSRARGTGDEDSDWDFMVVVPDSADDERVDLGRLWPRLRDLRRSRVEVFPIRRRDFDEQRHVLGELAEAAEREGRVAYEAPCASGAAASRPW